MVNHVFWPGTHGDHSPTPGLDLRPSGVLYDGRDQPQRPGSRHDGEEVILALSLDRDLALTLPLPPGGGFNREVTSGSTQGHLSVVKSVIKNYLE